MALHVCIQVLKILSAQLIKLLLILGGLGKNPGPTKKLKCGSCKKQLGKSTKNKPFITARYVVGSIINALGCLMQTNTTAITLSAPNASAKELYQQHFQTTRTYKKYINFSRKSIILLHMVALTG